MKNINFNKRYLKYLNENVMNDERLKGKENEMCLYVLSFLAFKETLRLQRINEDNLEYIYPSLEDIGKSINVKTPRLITESIVDLQTMGYITKTEQGKARQCNRYFMKSGITSYNNDEVVEQKGNDIESSNTSSSENDKMKEAMKILNGNFKKLADIITEQNQKIEFLLKQNELLSKKVEELEQQKNDNDPRNANNAPIIEGTSRKRPRIERRNNDNTLITDWFLSYNNKISRLPQGFNKVNIDNNIKEVIKKNDYRDINDTVGLTVSVYQHLLNNDNSITRFPERFINSTNKEFNVDMWKELELDRKAKKFISQYFDVVKSHNAIKIGRVEYEDNPALDNTIATFFNRKQVAI